MASAPTFADLLTDFILKEGRHVRQLEAEIVNQFGTQARVPHNTINRWKNGDVQRPRHWQDILKLATVLHLTSAETAMLLDATGHPSFSTLQGQMLSKSERGLFDFWHKKPLAVWEAPFQLPPAIPTFIGREEEVEVLSKVLRSRNRRRICCILGMAGLGKTSLANYLGYYLRDAFPDGVLWVSLKDSDQLTALDSIATSLQKDVRQYSDVGTRSSKVREWLAHKQLLLILDNAESDEQIRPLLPPSGSCAVLITSRRQDLAITDSAFRLILTPFKPEKAESLALFSRILGQQTVAKEHEQFSQIADLLGHLPLAISIIAYRLAHEPGWHVAHLHERLQKTDLRLGLLHRGDQHVRLSFMLSYQALSSADQLLFSVLGIFASDSFEATAVSALTNQSPYEVSDGLRRLFALSLVQVNRNQDYYLHPLLKDFSREQCQLPNLQARYIAYYLDYIKTHAPQGRAVIESAFANCLDALMLAIGFGMETAVASGLAFYPYLQQRGLIDTALTMLKGIEQIARDNPDSAQLMPILQNLGYTAMKKGQPEQAESYYQEALALAKESDNTPEIAELLLKLGALAYRRGQMDDAQLIYEEGLGIARQHDSKALIASFLANLGLIADSTGQLKKAIAHYEEALPLARKTDNHSLISGILQNLGNQFESRGDYAQAKQQFAEGLNLANQINDPELKSRMLGNLGLVACQLGNYAEASAHFRSGLALADKHELTIQLYRQQANLGRVTSLRGQHERANLHYQEALKIVRDLNFPEDYGMILNQAGDCFFAQANFTEAESHYTEALEMTQGIELTLVVPMSLFGLAQISAVRGNVSQAVKLGQQSYDLLNKAGHKKANEVWWWLKELPSDVIQTEGQEPAGSYPSLSSSTKQE